MSTTTRDDDADHRPIAVESSTLDRYAHLSLDNGETVIYDRQNEAAWLQSASGIGLAFMR